MYTYKPSIFPTFLSAMLAGAVVMATGSNQSVQASPIEGQISRNMAIALQFQPPGDAAPRSSIGGGTRGNVRFSTPGDAAPTNSTGGGTRGEVRFSSQGQGEPSSTVGGGSRGDVRFPASGESAPGNTASGGTSTDEQLALTALLPSTRYGHTVAAHPTFFVYVPPSAAKEIFFSLQDERRNHVYQTVLKISSRGGIVSVKLPEDAPALEMGKNYVWFFAPIQPGQILQPDNHGVTGWIKRVENQTAQNSSATPLELASEYAKNGIWYDTLAILASAKQAQPDNATLASEWRDLLKQVGLEALATQAIAEQL